MTEGVKSENPKKIQAGARRVRGRNQCGHSARCRDHLHLPVGWITLEKDGVPWVGRGSQIVHGAAAGGTVGAGAREHCEPHVAGHHEVGERGRVAARLELAVGLVHVSSGAWSMQSGGLLIGERARNRMGNRISKTTQPAPK